MAGSPNSQHHLTEAQQHDVGVGTEIHTAVYVAMGLGYAWIGFMAWLAFGWNTGVSLDLYIASFIIAMMMGLPMLAYLVSRSHLTRKLPSWADFFNSSVETATGRMQGWQAAIEIAVIPLALAFGGTLIGIVWMLTPAGGASSG